MLSCELAVLHNTVHHSVVTSLTSSSLLCCSKLLLYAILGYIVFSALCISPLPCGSVVLHRVIETERCRCWVSEVLCCVCESLRANVTSVLCRHCPTQQLALARLGALRRSSCLLSISVTCGCVLLPCSALHAIT